MIRKFTKTMGQTSLPMNPCGHRRARAHTTPAPCHTLLPLQAYGVKQGATGEVTVVIIHKDIDQTAPLSVVLNASDFAPQVSCVRACS